MMPTLLILSFVLLLAWLRLVARNAYRIYKRVRHPSQADWQMAEADPSQRLRADWISELTGMGFELAGYLSKDRQTRPLVALLIHHANCDSAHVAQINSSEKNFLVFKTRFADGFAFETGNTRNPSLYPADPQNPVFRFPQIEAPADLYRVHTAIKKEFSASRRPVIANPEGEMAEFISRAKFIRHRMMTTRDHKPTASGDAYSFTVHGAIRHAAALTWPIRTIRQLVLRWRASRQLGHLGLTLDPTSGRISV